MRGAEVQVQSGHLHAKCKRKTSYFLTHTPCGDLIGEGARELTFTRISRYQLPPPSQPRAHRTSTRRPATPSDAHRRTRKKSTPPGRSAAAARPPAPSAVARRATLRQPPIHGRIKCPSEPAVGLRVHQISPQSNHAPLLGHTPAIKRLKKLGRAQQCKWRCTGIYRRWGPLLSRGDIPAR